MAFARLWLSRGSASNPFSPFFYMFGMPPKFEPTIGIPEAIASKLTIPNDSAMFVDGKQNISADL